MPVALLRVALVVMLLAGAARAQTTGVVAPLSPADGAPGRSAPAAPTLDWRSPAPPSAAATPAAGRHHLLLWLWGGLGVLLLASIAVTVQDRTAPQPLGRHPGLDRTFP